jgi:hypothetical protein
MADDALQKVCQRAYDRGIGTDETSGELRHWMVLRSYGRTARTVPKIHEGHVFIFVKDLLLTSLDLPAGVHAQAWRLRK